MTHGKDVEGGEHSVAATPNTVRSFIGRKLSGPVTAVRLTEGPTYWRFTVQQKSGPAQNFRVSTHVSREWFVVDRLLSAVRVVVGVAVMLFSFLMMVTGIQLQIGSDREFAPFLGAEGIFLFTLLVGQRLVFTNSLRRRHQVCPHIPQIAKVVERADPASGTWAAEAVNALRQGTFCLASPQVHAMAAAEADPSAPVPAGSAVDRLAGQIEAAATALVAHGRSADAGAVRELLDCLPELAVLDQVAVGQATDAVTRSYALLEQVPVALHTVPSGAGRPTPQQDAEASVGAALAELTRLIRLHADNDIQALQALRIYTQQWQRTDQLDL